MQPQSIEIYEQTNFRNILCVARLFEFEDKYTYAFWVYAEEPMAERSNIELANITFRPYYIYLILMSFAAGVIRRCDAMV